ncbi:MAG: bifunctional diaminohydroxyphosphoribosylaminopyrimidine deaminase/5-amino-6-(5-phosphoribosylamino)uracil reductase RibD [Calditrichaeota bacterium]|nr:bifunctional diaminohydroxyphosphoribosylaminopyrimidine deaminase/5-amino-6-(5-phosphoribosylamino)uracil reductase RibD [Calditrichota bacterium]
MRLALKEAEKGAGHVSPNPLVGAVAVKGDKLLGKAYHRRFGEPHAEALLISKLTREEAQGSTIYVNLEPCCHIGKTPPCTSALISAGVARVVVAMQDPNPLVNGKGMMQLSDAGVKVTLGVCEAEAQRLNAPFVTFMEKGRPWLLLKVAQSLDGRIALANGTSRWITGEASRKEVHAIRSRLDAVLVGALTVLDDDPELTVRHVRGRNPIRVIADSTLRIPEDARLLRHKHPELTWILTTENADPEKAELLKSKGIELIVCRASHDGKVDLRHAMRELARRGITSILVEGGGTVHAAMLRAGLCDELIVAVAPMLIGADGKASIGELELNTLKSAPRFRTYRHRVVGDDHWYYLEKDVHGNS